MMACALRLCSFLLLLAVNAANATNVIEENDVLVLDRTNFNDIVKEKDTLLVEFYAPWCGHCKDLEPKYAAAAKILKEKNIALAKVDATKEPDLGSDHGVEGYPTLKIFKKAFPGESFDYEGPRDTPGIVQFMENVATPQWKPPFQLSGLHPLTKANLSESLEKQASWLVGFIESDAQRSDPNLVAAADQLKRGRERKAVGLIDVSGADGKDLAKRYSIELNKLPVFAVLMANKDKAIAFGYELNADNLVKFYRAHSSDQSPPSQSFATLTDINAVNDGVEALLIGFFSDAGSSAREFLMNFLTESGFMLDRRLEGGAVTEQLAKQLGLKTDVIYVRLPSKLLAKGEQQLLEFTGSLTANELKQFYDSVSLPLVGYYSWNTKELYRAATKPVCLFLLTVSFKGEMQSSTAMWHARFAKAVAKFKGNVLFAMADDEQEEDEVKAFRLDDSSSDVNVGCYDTDKRRYALSEMDSFDSDELQSFIQQLLNKKLTPVIRSVTARSSTGPVQELTGDNFNKLVLTNNKNQFNQLIFQCDFSLQPCKQSLSEFTAAAADPALAQEFNVKFGKLDTKFNDASGNYFYRFNPNDLEMSQPQVLLGIKGKVDQPIRFEKSVVSQDYIVQFIRDNLKSVKSEL